MRVCACISVCVCVCVCVRVCVFTSLNFREEFGYSKYEHLLKGQILFFPVFPKNLQENVFPLHFCLTQL